MLPGLAVMMLQSDLVSGLSVKSSPALVERTVSSTSGGSLSVTSPTTTAVASGGTGPYTYAWVKLDGDSRISATFPSAAATEFTATLPPETFVEASYRVTAIDTITLGSAHFDVDVSLQHVDLR
jgi:hypothetical protein